MNVLQNLNGACVTVRGEREGIITPVPKAVDPTEAKHGRNS